MKFQWWTVSLVNAIPFAGKKKGSYSGIDGLIYFKPEGKTTEKAIVSVKGERWEGRFLRLFGGPGGGRTHNLPSLVSTTDDCVADRSPG